MSRRGIGVAGAAIAALALPASASADLVVSQTASPKPVKKGELVTIMVSVTNPGPAVAGTWRRSANGRRLTATVPASRIFSPRIGKAYRLTIQATRKGAHALKRTITFELCG